MKKKGLRISLILIVICAIILAPIGGLSVKAQEISDADYVENETEYIETEEQESELESDMIIEGGMIEILPRDEDTAEIQVDGLVVTPVIKDDGSYGLSDGVYAFENIGNSGLFMDIQQDKYLPGYHMQQYAASGNPATTFDRSCLFKITWRSTTNSYIIRSMLNNRLTFYFSGNEVLTKEIPPNDADVPDSDTFTLTYIVGSGSFIIKPYNSTYVVAANNTTASGMAGAPDSYLKKSTGIAAGDQGKWRMYKYTGATQSGVVTHKSISNTNGIEVGTTISIALKTWTTEIGKNTPHLIVNPDYTDMVTVNDWDDDTYTLTFTPIKAGTFKLRGIIRADGTETAFRTYALTYYAVPPVNGKTTFIENVGTEKFVDIEGSSSNTGAIIEQDQFSGQEQAKWIFEVQSSGYFRIKSAYSNKYIGVESNGAPTTVKQYATSSDYTLWRITETSSGNYKLSCKATEASGYVLAAQSQTAGNGSNLEMTAYTEDTNYRDEWNWFLSSAQLNDVPHNLRSNANHLCIPCAITNVMAYWSINGYSQFDCATAAKQEQKAIAVQNNMNANGSCSANLYIQFGFDLFSHTENGKTYVPRSTNYWCKDNTQEFSYQDIIEELNGQRPLMLGYALHDDSPYGGGHMTVCVGYETDNSELYVYVSDAHKDYFVRHKYDSSTYNDFICKISIVSMEE